MTTTHTGPTRAGAGRAPETALRVAVGADPGEAGVRLTVTRSSPWAGFLGQFPLPDDLALDTLADALEDRDLPRAIVLAGAPAACLLPALWLRTIWLTPETPITLEWTRVVPPGADVGETLAARLCATLVDEIACDDPAAALAQWAIECGPRRSPDLDAFDLALGLVDAWDLRLQWTLGSGRSAWLFRARRALEDCASRGHRRVALYGAGTHTRALGPVLLDPPVEVVSIIDDHLGGAGRRLWGFPVVTPAEALTLALDAVILSANTREDELWAASAALRHAGIEVVRLYGRGERDEADADEETT